MNIRQALIQNIETDLLKTLTANGYNYSVNKVYKHFVGPEQVNVYPAITSLWFEFQNAEKESIDEAKTQFFVKENWMIGGYVKITQDVSLTGTLVVEAEKLKADIENNVENRKPQSFTINQINGVDYAYVNQDYPYIIGSNNIVGVVKGVQISYIQTEDSNNINITLPTAPGLNQPSNGGTVTTLYPAMDWASVANAISYHIQVGTDLGFNSIIIDQDGIDDSSFTIPNDDVLTNGNTYYWRVRAFGQYGYSAWSGAWSFTTDSIAIEEKDWNEFVGSNGWWNSYSTTGNVIVSGSISATLDQIGSRNLTQSTSSRRISLSGNAYGSLSSLFFNPTFASESDCLVYNDTSGVFKWGNSTTGSLILVMMSNGTHFDYNSSYFCPLARSNTSFGGEVSLTRGVNTGPGSNCLAYPQASGDWVNIPIGLNQPQHIIITHSGSASQTVYLNGSKIGQISKPFTTISTEANSYIVLGAYYEPAINHGSGKFSGHVFELGFNTTVLTQTQVTASYEKFKTRFGL